MGEFPPAAAIAFLGQTLRGALIGREDARYESARRVWNGRIDRRPLLIAQCLDAADIVACVHFAQDHALPLAVRGSGHACAGTALCDGGLVVDLSRMKGVRVVPDQGVARAQPGVTWGDMDHATLAFGLAVPGGTDSEVGIAGLSLGGGNGWLMGAFGATCDNILSIDLVTAEGKLLTASAAEHQDLFWALRGGGGNFGIATSFEYRMHPVGPRVVAGAVLYPFEQTREVLARFRDFAEAAPDPLTVYPCLIRLEDGAPVLCMAACYAGPVEEGTRAVAPLRHMGEPLADQLKPMPFVEWQKSMDAARPAGRRCAMRSHFLTELADGFIDAVIESFATCPSRHSVAIVEHCHGAIARVVPTATAFALRTNPYHFEIIAFWDDPAETEANIAWCNRFFGATVPFSSGEVYVNSLDEGEEHRIREAYGPNWERLTQIKKRYDPTNFFHCNQNIPAADENAFAAAETGRDGGHSYPLAATLPRGSRPL
jgi:FAD/FMN-containing dehydrogenase